MGSVCQKGIKKQNTKIHAEKIDNLNLKH